MFLLRLRLSVMLFAKRYNLHSNMFLLRLKALWQDSYTVHNLHSNMFLLRPDTLHWLRLSGIYLHSNMFLLRLVWRCCGFRQSVQFTFQYVSIKTLRKIRPYKDIPNLHSNMFLLRLLSVLFPFMWFTWFTFQYVSIKTQLIAGGSKWPLVFTFQYVSIKTSTAPTDFSQNANLHSNMFLLRLTPLSIYHFEKNIYIPICFY